MSDDKRYYVYMLASRSRNLYVGVTSDLKHRVWQHKRGVVEGFTSRYKIYRLVYFESYTDVRDALQREKQIKAWRRARKVALISRHNPTWRDLSSGWYEERGLEKADPSPPRESRARDDSRERRGGAGCHSEPLPALAVRNLLVEPLITDEP